MKAARTNGISDRTLRRAKQDLGVIADKAVGVAYGAWFSRPCVPPPDMVHTTENRYTNRPGQRFQPWEREGGYQDAREGTGTATLLGNLPAN
jgi:hypothetical protein